MAWVIDGKFEVKLKQQLLLLGLLSLLFPITTWVSLKNIDKEYRSSMELATEKTLYSLQSAVLEWSKLEIDDSFSGTSLTQISEFILDGDSSEWNEVPVYEYKNDNQSLKLQFGKFNSQITLFINSNDNSIGFGDDFVLIGLGNDHGIFQLKILRQPEGLVQIADSEINYQAYWHETLSGFQLEVLIESQNFDHIGVVANNRLAETNEFVGYLDQTNRLQLEKITGLNQKTVSFVENINPNNSLLTIYDENKSVIYHSDKLPKSSQPSKWQWLLTPFYQWLFGIKNSNSEQSWFYDDTNGLAGIQKISSESGLIFELKSLLPKGQQAMIQTVLKASLLTLAFVMLILFAYFIYSLILAWRIKRLNQSLQTVLDDQGFHVKTLPSNKAKDEIGELSRGLESMLSELNHYTNYLKDLGSRLSHEMRTPLAIVQSSLDNLELENDPEFLQRARHGTQRLKFILNQLSEMSRLKQSLEKSPKQIFNLSKFCTELGLSYAEIIPQFESNIEDKDAWIEGCPDLIGQMLDKLIENARDFTPAKGVISLSLESTQNTVVVSIFNTGSKLPDGQNVFDSLVSVRSKEEKSESTHLGLGLYLVKLIAKYHNAELKAEECNGVKFSIRFNKVDKINL